METESLFKWVAVLLAAAALAACATTRPAPEYRIRTPEYSFGFYNATEVELNDCKIVWDDHGSRRKAEAGIISSKAFARSHFEPDPVPAMVKLSWTSSDGKYHERELEVAKKVPDLKKFSGTIWFRIGQDEKDVKVVPRTYDEQERLAIEQKPYWPK